MTGNETNSPSQLVTANPLHSIFPILPPCNPSETMVYYAAFEGHKAPRPYKDKDKERTTRMNRKFVVIERSDNFETGCDDYPIKTRAVAVRSTEEKAMDAAFNASKAAFADLKSKVWTGTRIGFAPDGGIMVTGFSKNRTWTLTYTISSTEDFE